MPKGQFKPLQKIKQRPKRSFELLKIKILVHYIMLFTNAGCCATTDRLVAEQTRRAHARRKQVLAIKMLLLKSKYSKQRLGYDFYSFVVANVVFRRLNFTILKTYELSEAASRMHQPATAIFW